MNLSGVKSGDIVLVDGPAAKGGDGEAQALSRYHAHVLGPAGPGRIEVRRLHGPARAFPVRARLVVGHWRKSKATTYER